MQTLTKVEEFRLILLVRNLAAQRKFYEETFNWQIINDWGGGILYNTGAAVFELIEDLKAEKPNSSYRIAIKVPDVWALFDLLKDKVTVVQELKDSSWGDTSFRITDPEGFPITIFTPTELKETKLSLT